MTQLSVGFRFMPDQKALEAGRIARSLVALWLNDQETDLVEIIGTLIRRGDPELLGYVLLEQATTTGQLGLLLAKERGASLDEIMQALWLSQYGDDLGL